MACKKINEFDYNRMILQELRSHKLVNLLNIHLSLRQNTDGIHEATFVTRF